MTFRAKGCGTAASFRRRGEAILDLHRCHVCSVTNAVPIGAHAPERCSGCGSDLVQQRIVVHSPGAFQPVTVRTMGDGTRRVGILDSRRSEDRASAAVADKDWIKQREAPLGGTRPGSKNKNRHK